MIRNVTFYFKPANKRYSLEAPHDGHVFNGLEILKRVSSIYDEFSFTVSTHPNFDYKIEKIMGKENTDELVWLIYVNEKLSPYNIYQTLIKATDELAVDYCWRIPE